MAPVQNSSSCTLYKLHRKNLSKLSLKTAGLSLKKTLSGNRPHLPFFIFGTLYGVFLIFLLTLGLKDILNKFIPEYKETFGEKELKLLVSYCYVRVVQTSISFVKTLGYIITVKRK